MFSEHEVTENAQQWFDFNNDISEKDAFDAERFEKLYSHTRTIVCEICRKASHSIAELALVRELTRYYYNRRPDNKEYQEYVWNLLEVICGRISEDELMSSYATEGNEVSSVKTITFGRYPQTETGEEQEIVWRILADDGKKALIISEKALDCMPFNNDYDDTTWEECAIRKWLNVEFITKAFSRDEQNRILLTAITADKNPECATFPGNDTTDRVFLLSSAEINRFFDSDKARVCLATAFAKKQGAHCIFNHCRWWLRSPGDHSDFAAIVRNDGSVDNQGDYVRFGNICVRPALWINLDS